jgi:hypothetical protein
MDSALTKLQVNIISIAHQNSGKSDMEVHDVTRIRFKCQSKPWALDSDRNCSSVKTTFTVGREYGFQRAKFYEIFFCRINAVVPAI